MMASTSMEEIQEDPPVTAATDAAATNVTNTALTSTATVASEQSPAPHLKRPEPMQRFTHHATAASQHAISMAPGGKDENQNARLVTVAGYVTSDNLHYVKHAQVP